ncbi:MAG: fused MFS/spermidine synthase [Thermodesulfobacteriota bacterium]
MLELTVFSCGAAVMVLEMAGARILAPYLGSSLVVWSALIGVVLASLSAGYWWGGRLADRRPEPRLLSGLILLAALAVAATALSKTMLLGFLLDYASGPRLSAVLANLLLFAPAAALLGTVSPFAVRLALSSTDQAGRTAGRLYALSTAGSIAGTFLAGFVLLPAMGSTSLLFVVALALAATSLCAHRSRVLAPATAGGLILLLWAGMAAYDERLDQLGVHDRDTAYSRILVHQSRDPRNGRATRVMSTNPRHVQSAMYLDEPGELVLDYTRFFALAGRFAPRLERVLVLGGGAYSVPRRLLADHPGLAVDVVELDPGVTDLARRFFGLADAPGLTLFHEDGRTFINREHPPYDAVLVDVFDTHYAPPFHLATLEAVRRVRALLAEDGVVMVNCIAAREGPASALFRAQAATWAAAFPQVEAYALEAPDDASLVQNLVLVARPDPAAPPARAASPDEARLLAGRFRPDPDRTAPLTDEFAPVEQLALALH